MAWWARKDKSEGNLRGIFSEGSCTPKPNKWCYRVLEQKHPNGTPYYTVQLYRHGQLASSVRYYGYDYSYYSVQTHRPRVARWGVEVSPKELPCKDCASRIGEEGVEMMTNSEYSKVVQDSCA